MQYLNLEAIRDVDDVKTTDVDLTDDWGGFVKVRGMSGRLRNNLENKIASNAPHSEIKMMVVLECTLAEDGSPLFNKNTDKKWLVEKSARPIEAIFEAACKLSGFGEKAVEEAEGNL